MKKTVIIIGGGASGLMAAYFAAENSKHAAKVIIIEKNKRPARKVMITGKGRCNVTNNSDVNTLIANVPHNGKFLYSAFSQFSARDTMEWFENKGVALKTERGNRVFPVSDKSTDIVDALVRAVKSAGAVFVRSSAKQVLVQNGAVNGVKLENGSVIYADSVIIATGGISYPLTGSTGDGYKIAGELGHTVSELSASLVPLECREGYCSSISGLSLKNIELSVFEPQKKKPLFCETGEMLFTHFGISGPLVLSASAHLNFTKCGEYNAFIDLKPALSKERLDKRILRDFEEEKNRDFCNALDKLLPKSIIPVIVAASKIPAHIKVNQINREQRSSLAALIKHLPLHITSTAPVEQAVITRGGVSVKQIDPKSMQSKLVKNLFFAGEVIDVDAYTGGFNLQIAFSTGAMAGKNAVKNNEDD